VEKQADVGLFKALFDVKWDHKQMVVVDPDRLGVVQGCFDLQNLLRHLLIDGQVFFPVLEVVIAHVSDVFEVMEERSEDVLVVEQTGFEVFD
jgi:hypothetical protein